MDSDIPRIEFDNLRPDVQALLEPRVARLGYLGEFFKCAANQPDLLAPFIQLTEALPDALPKKLIEVGALTAALLMGSAYERHQHEQLCLKLGYGLAWISQVEALDPDVAAMSDDEKAFQAFIMALFRDRGKGVERELGALIERLGPQAAVAAIFLAGRYAVHALFVNSLDLSPPAPSVFAKEAVA